MILSTLLRLPLLDISTWAEGCSCLSRHITAVLIRIPPIQHPVMLLFKKLPVHHKHPPFYVPRLRRKRKERNQPSLKHKLTALSRLTWHQRSDVPDIALNFHNKVTPQLLVTQRPQLIKLIEIFQNLFRNAHEQNPEYPYRSCVELLPQKSLNHINHCSLISLMFPAVLQES